MDDPVAIAKEKFNDLQKYVPFLEKFTSCINNNEQFGDEAFVEKRQKCLKLLKMLKNDFSERLKLSLLLNIENTVKKLMEQSGDRLTQSKSYKKEPSEHGNQSPEGSSNHGSLRQTKNETVSVSTSKDRKEIRNSYNEDKHRSHYDSRRSEYRSRSPDSYRHRSPADHRRRSPENYRVRRSRSRSSERYKSDDRHRTDKSRRSRSRHRNFHREHKRSDEGYKRERSYDYSRDREKLDLNESYSHRSRHESSHTRDDRDKSRYTNSPLPSVYDRSRSKVRSVFDRLEPRTNSSNKPPVKRQRVASGKSRFESNAEWDDGSPPRKIIDEALSELESLTQNRFGRSKEDDKLSDIMKRQQRAEQLRAELKNQEQMEIANKILNELQGSGDYVRKDSNPVINLLDKAETKKTNESSERIDRNGSLPNSENSIPSQRTAVASQERSESIMNKSSSRPQYINPWLNQQPDLPHLNGNESGLQATVPPRVFGEHVTSHGNAITSDQSLQAFYAFGNSSNLPLINPLHNNNGNLLNNTFPIVEQTIHNEQYPINRETVPIIAAPQDKHPPFSQNSNLNQHVSNEMQPNQRPFNENPTHNSPAQVNRKANMSYGQYKRTKESLEKSHRSNILVTTTTASNAGSSAKTVTQVDSSKNSNKTNEKGTPAKNISESSDKRSEDVPANSATRTSTPNKSINKYRIPKLNRSDSSNNSTQQNQLQKPSEKSRKSSNQKHTEKTKEKTPIRAKTKDKDRRRSENSQVIADTTTDSEQIQNTSSSRNESNVVNSSIPAFEQDDNDDVVSSSTSRRESSGSAALNSSLSDSNEVPNKEKRKAAKTKKSELDRLNEDIMANCNDVVMATGKRACTISSRKGQSEDSILRAATYSDELNSGESSEEILGKPKAKRKKVIKSKLLIDDSSDDSETGNDEISLPRTRPGPKCSSSAKKPLQECIVILDRLDEATIHQYTKRNEDKYVSCIQNTNPKMTAKDSKECVICKKSYRQLVRHYNSVHENVEVYCSRMPIENSNKIRNGKNIQKIINDKGKPSVRCLFCDKQVRKDSIGRVIDHFMSHTGEYIKKCTKCGVTVDANTAKTSNCAHTKHRQENLVQFTDNIYVFMCNICNYAQSQEENLKKHIEKMHEIKSNVFEQYKKIVLVTNVGGRRRTNNKESESNDGKISNPEAFKPTKQNDVSNEEHKIQIIKENSFDESSSNVQTARKRTMADQLHERLGGGEHDTQSNSMKSESGEEAINVVLRGADEVSDNDTEKTNDSSDQEYLTGEAIENMYKIEIAKEEIHTSPNVKNGKSGTNDEEDWESCSTGTDDDDQSNGKFDNKMSTRLTSVSGKSKISKTKFKLKKRNDKSIFGTMSCKLETSEESVNLVNEDDNINLGASTSQQCLGIESSMKDDSRRIENFAYTQADTQLKYTCYIGHCNFISLNNSSSFSNHLRKQHSEAWKGYCHSCDKQILNGSFSLMKEFNHMMEIHLPDVNKPHKPIRSSTSDLVFKSNPEPESAVEGKIAEPPEPEKPVFRLKLRRLSGDLLSGPAASNTGIIISNVTSLSVSENEINNLQLPVEPKEEDNTTDNLVKPWTKCPNTKSYVAYKKLRRQISLVALFKCMAFDCIFTTSDRSAMLTHLNNHEDFLMQPTNNVPSNTDSDSWLECCYCEQILDSCTVLVDHIEQQHSSSIFQCAYCFYRSVDPCNVNSHINVHHKDKCRMVLICGTHPKCLSEEIDILTSKSKNLRRVPCTFPGCDDSFLHLDDLNNHLDQSHEGKTYFRCPFCPMRLTKSDIGGIDVTHFQYHNIALYHCPHCPEFATFDSDSMQKHLRDEHPNHLAYAVARFDNSLMNTELCASIARAYRSEKYYRICHSVFTPDQINFMNPSLSEYVANSGEVPNTYQDSAKAKANEITFKEKHRLERITRERLHKKYHVYTFDQLNTGSWKTSPIQMDKQLSENEEAVTINETTGQADYITSIQNEIDASAKALLCETGVPNESIYRCGFTDCHWLGSSVEGNEFLDHLSQHHLTNNSHKCYHCNVEFSKPVELKNHIDATHTIHRYFCFLCNNTEASEQCMIEHFKGIHKNNFLHFIQLNPCQIDKTKDIFVGCPMNVSFINDFGMKLIERKENKMLKKKYYSPEELNLLPIRQVFTDNVHCKRCNYRTKVRLNMERHLSSCKGSNPNETNPEQAPVNPVPHLDMGQMHSDKMKNLAASSNLTGDSTIEKDPSLRYVPETERFMCGADGCSYKTTASEYLEEHLECSHKDQATYYCPHCRAEIAEGVYRSVEIINHLRLHSELIFKCSVCLYGHHERNEVETHISDVHPKATVQRIIRPQKQIEFVKPAAKSIISKWKCNICTNKFNSKLQVKQHLSTDHQIKHMYQCGMCTFQDDAKARIKEHLMTVHNQNDASQLKMFFEQVGIDTDNSPLWKRDDPTRIKNIRGIYFEDEEKTNGDIPNVKPTSSNRKQTWTCDIPSFASKSSNQDRFVIVPSKATVDESAIEGGRPRPPPIRQMPKRRASMFVSSPSELTSSSSSNPQPPIPKIRFKRINIDENLMPPPAKVSRVYGPRNDSNTNRSSLIYQCDYCSMNGSSSPQLEDIRLHWQQAHQKDNSDDPEAKQFRYRATVQVLCVHCNETMAFASIWEHLSRMHSNANFAFAKFNPNPSADIHCGMCLKRVSNNNELEVHFSNEHISSINSKAKVQPLPFFNDTIVETLIDQGNHESVKCSYCQEKFICKFDYEQHHQQYHPANVESHEPTDSNIIKYGCIECQMYSTNRNNIISHIWKKHIQSRYQCLYCSKETQFQKLIRTHHELAHKSNDVKYRIVDATKNVPSFYRMSMNFSNGLVLFWGDILKTKFSQVKQLIDHVNELNRAELESYTQSTEASVNDVPTPGRIGFRRRQTHLL